MKKLFYLLVLIFQVSFAQNAFETGNQLYQKEKYEEAINSYESILNSGKHSAALYFNLGNCYYKLHKVAPAIYYYEKALLLNPNDTDIKTNLDFARKMTIDEIKVIPKVGFHKLIENFTSQFYYDTWAWITVVLSFVFLLFFIGYYFSMAEMMKRVFFMGMIVVLLGMSLTGFSGFISKKHYDNNQPAIVFAESAAVKSEPKINAQDAFTLHEGTKVFVLENVANWYKIQLTDETTGWIESKAIKTIKQ